MTAKKRILIAAMACVMLTSCRVNSGSSSESSSDSEAVPAMVSSVVKADAVPAVRTDDEIKKPANVSGSVCDTGFVISWDECGDADGVEIRMYISGSEEVHIFSNIKGGSFSIPDQQDGTKAEFEVYAFRFDGDEKVYSQSSEKIELEMPVYGSRIDIKSVCQYAEPALPTGCECTALTTVLKFYGFGVTKNEIAAKYLKTQKFKKKKGVLYGADPEKAFVGKPEDKHSYGCYSKPIADAANKYLKEQKSTLRAYVRDGEKLEYWFDKIDEGKPVIIWATDDMKKSKPTDEWLTKDGKTITWLKNEHCYVLAGYDTKKKIVFCCDPIDRTTQIKEYDISLFAKRYKEQGMHAVLIE